MGEKLISACIFQWEGLIADVCLSDSSCSLKFNAGCLLLAAALLTAKIKTNAS